MENEQFKQQELAQQQKNKQAEIKHCDECGATLSADDSFCPECGAKIGGEKKECKWCGCFTSRIICPECGKRVLPQICSKCGKENFFDICEQCGNILNKRLLQAVEKKRESVKEMSVQSAESIKKEFEKAETPELAAYRKRIKNHEILLAEKRFFDEREKRITEAFGENVTAIKYPDPAETKFLQEAAQFIKKDALRRQQKEIEANLEAKFPEAKSKKDAQAELLAMVKKREEMQKQQMTEGLAALEEEIEKAEAIERERKRLEIEAFNKRICGNYIHCSGSEEIRLIIRMDENGNIVGQDITTYSETAGSKFSNTEFVAEFSVQFNGASDLIFEEYNRRFIKNPNNLDVDDFLHCFEGTVNSDGTVINGHWFSDVNKNKMFVDYRKY